MSTEDLNKQTDLNNNSYFQVSGSLRAGSPSYISRKADDELLKAVSANSYAYVFTARQMGKSSLLHQTVAYLKENQVAACAVDVTRIGSKGISREIWYFTFLDQVREKLVPSYSREDLSNWWEPRQPFTPLSNFFAFWEEIILKQVNTKTVVFIDEIDAITAVGKDFGTEFLGAIRSCFNARADKSEFNKLTFVLLGVAEPNDLIENQQQSFFGIGEKIDLLPFTWQESKKFTQGLVSTGNNQNDSNRIFERVFYRIKSLVRADSNPNNSNRILEHIFSWTNGQPYLTQFLCEKIAQKPNELWDKKKIDQLVDESFISGEGQREININTIRRSIVLNDQYKNQLLQEYGRVLQNQSVKDDPQSQIQSYLKLFGLVRTQGEYLAVSNKIYHQVFNLEWVEDNLDEGFSIPQPPPQAAEPIQAGSNGWRWAAAGFLLILALVALFIFTPLGGGRKGPSGPPGKPGRDDDKKTKTPIAQATEEIPTKIEGENGAIQGEDGETPETVTPEEQGGEPTEVVIESTSTPTPVPPTKAETDTPEPSPVPVDTSTHTLTPPPPPPTPTPRAYHRPALQNLTCNGEPASYGKNATIPIKWGWQGWLIGNEYLEVRAGPAGGNLVTLGEVTAKPSGSNWEWNIVPEAVDFTEVNVIDYNWQVFHMSGNRQTVLATSPRGCFRIQ